MRVPQVSERIKEAPAQALRGVFAGIGQLLLITDKLRNKGSADSDVPRARTPEASETVTDTPVTSPVGQRAATAAATAEPATMEPAAAAPAPAAPAPAETVAAGQAVAAGEAEPAPAKAATAQAATARRTAAKAADGAAKPAAAKSATAKAAAAKAAAKPATARPTAVKAAPAQPAAEAPPKPPKRQSIRDLDKTGNVRLLGDEADSSPLDAAAPVAAEPIAAAEPASAAAEPASAAAQIAVPEPVSVAEPATAPLPNYDELSVASLRARLRNLDVAQVRRLGEYERAHAARADVLGMFERRIAKLEAEA